MMSEDRTARFALPLLHAGQAQKELDHNEALALLDMLVQPIVRGSDATVPPDAPVPGECWILGATPVGAWSGHAHALAGYGAGGWRFVVPHEGMTVADSAGSPMRYADGGWTPAMLVGAGIVVENHQVVGARRPAIEDPAGGMAADQEARLAIVAILSALRGHGLIAP
jgi:hypothetical protein